MSPPARCGTKRFGSPSAARAAPRQQSRGSRLSQLKRYSAHHSRSTARARHLMKRTIKLIVATIVILSLSVPRGGTPSCAADYPAPQAGDFVIRDFHFTSGETLPELHLHYRTLGAPRATARAIVRNAVLIMHGTTGEGGNFLRPEFAGQLLGKGQLLDASRYYLILPDGIGHGRSSRPSDGIARPLSALRLSRHGGGRLSAADRGAQGQPPAAGDGHVDGRHAHLAVGRTTSRFHGCFAAAGELAHADFGSQPHLAAGHHRRHPQRSRVEETATTRRSPPVSERPPSC